MWPYFMGAVAFNLIARFMADPRDRQKTPEYFEVDGTEEGIYGCLGLLSCEDVRPKNIPLQDQLGIPRRNMSGAR
jgi:fumarate reductase iron-sulfur subunit